MCGIFGFAKQSGHQTDAQIDKLRDVFTNLASDSVVRGEDSTGVSIISPDERRTFKSIVASDKIVKHETWRSNILDRIDRESTIGIGHVRLATHGDVTMRNAHPFEIGSVLGAHNGVIHNYNELAKKYNIPHQTVNKHLRSYSNRLQEIGIDNTLTIARESARITNLIDKTITLVTNSIDEKIDNNIPVKIQDMNNLTNLLKEIKKITLLNEEKATEIVKTNKVEVKLDVAKVLKELNSPEEQKAFLRNQVTQKLYGNQKD